MRYRQIAHRLRIAYGPGRPDVVSERPAKVNARTGERTYLDTEAPTVVEIGDDALVDVATLLACGAIARLPEEAPGGKGGKAPKAGASDG